VKIERLRLRRHPSRPAKASSSLNAQSTSVPWSRPCRRNLSPSLRATNGLRRALPTHDRGKYAAKRRRPAPPLVALQHVKHRFDTATSGGLIIRRSKVSTVVGRGRTLRSSFAPGVAACAWPGRPAPAWPARSSLRPRPPRRPTRSSAHIGSLRSARHGILRSSKSPPKWACHGAGEPD
jgi:hypothetical protein